MNNHVGSNIKKLKELKNMTQEYVAKSIGISQSSYSDIENCHVLLTDERLLQISEVLGLPVELVKSFNESVFFHNCTQSGYNNTYHITNPIDQIQDLTNQLLKVSRDRILELEDQIKQLEDELRKMQ